MKKILISTSLIAVLTWTAFNISGRQEAPNATGVSNVADGVHTPSDLRPSLHRPPQSAAGAAGADDKAATETDESGQASFQGLIDAADKGHPQAALAVAQAIWKCRDVPTSRAQYEQEIRLSANAPADDEHQVLETIDWCQGKPRDRSLTERYLRVAADAGLPEAMVEYAVLAPVILSSAPFSAPLSEDGRAEMLALDQLMLDYLRRAAEAGYPTAAAFLGRAYAMNVGEGIVAEGDPLIRPADPAEAYAWYYAYAIVDQSPNSRRKFERMEYGLRASQELVSARARGQALYAQYFAGSASGS